MSSEPIVLVALGDPENKPLLYACSKCGHVNSPGIYMARKEEAHRVAKEAARDCYNCRANNTCSVCGEECHKGWTVCGPCRLAKKLAAATEIEDDGGPYFEFGGDRYYHDIWDAAEDGVEWVAPCTVTYPKLNADSILETLTDDMHEDASVDDLDDVKAFHKAVERFNKAQTTASYWADETRKIRVPAAETANA